MKPTGCLLIIATVAAVLAEDRNVTAVVTKGRKVRRGDNLLPQVMSELTSALQEQLQQIAPMKNSVFSPVSIISVLGMVMLGARGKTYKEMSKTLLGHVPGKLEKNVATMHRKLKVLLERLEQHPESKPGAHISLANAVFVQKGLEVQDTFSRSVENIYNSSIQALDFLSDSEGAKNAINSWANDHTKGVIKELFAEPLDSNTELVLANALHFVGEWEAPFDPQATTMKPFHGINGDINVPMMRGDNGKLKYYQSAELNCTIIGKSYKGEHVTMYFVLPQNNLTEFMNEVSANDLLLLFKEKPNFYEERIILHAPKLNLKTLISLQEPLGNIGLKSLFGPEANLRGISDGVFVNEAVHKVRIEVTETGTIAAAITAFISSRMSPPTVIINKPFLFCIYHEKAKIPLFWGTVFDPTA